MRELVPLRPRWARGETLLYSTGRNGKPVLLLAGHLDTVPAQGNRPGRIDGGAVQGLGAADMKGGVAVMVELARWIADGKPELGVDVDFLFFPLEEVDVALSPLPELFDTGLVADADLVVVLEPTDNAIHAGCLGNLVARLTFRGESAHSARPWTGVNAIRLAAEGLAPLLAVEPLDVERGGLVFREVVSVTELRAGVAANVIPGEAVATVNYRYAPGRSRADAEAQLRRLAGARRRARDPVPRGRGRRGPRPAAARSPDRARQPCRRAEAGLDAGGAVRGARPRRGQLRPGVAALRAPRRRAGRDRGARALVRDAEAALSGFGSTAQPGSKV